jgi:hypothetical protein
MTAAPSNPLRTTDDSSEPSLQAAKWMTHQLLLDNAEMESLFRTFEQFEIYRVGTIVALGEERVPHDTFLRNYAGYIAALKGGQMPIISDVKKAFAVVFTSRSEALFAYCLSPTERLIRVAQPVIQVQAHFMHYSTDDNKFRPMVFGPDCITWGLQLSYPQIYLDNNTKQIVKVMENERFANNVLYRKLQRWLRTNTRPTPMIIGNERINIPIRIGSKCFDWINNHPQLKERSIHVAGGEL